MFRVLFQIYKEPVYDNNFERVELFKKENILFQSIVSDYQNEELENKIISFLMEMSLMYGDEKITFEWRDYHKKDLETERIISEKYSKIRIRDFLQVIYRNGELNKTVIESIRGIKKTYVAFPCIILIENELIKIREDVEILYDTQSLGKERISFKYFSPINTNFKIL